MVHDFVARAALHNQAAVHHDNLVAEACHQINVVADEYNRKISRFAKICEQAHNLRLNRHIEGGGRLVSNQKFAALSKRECD